MFELIQEDAASFKFDYDRVRWSAIKEANLELTIGCWNEVQLWRIGKSYERRFDHRRGVTLRVATMPEHGLLVAWDGGSAATWRDSTIDLGGIVGKDCESNTPIYVWENGRVAAKKP